MPAQRRIGVAQGDPGSPTTVQDLFSDASMSS
jgi:hypothetical protein